MVEIIKITTQLCCPQVDVLADAIHQMMAVLEDELAGEDDKSLGQIAAKSTEAVVEQLRKLGGIGCRGSIVQATSRVESNACFGGVGDDEADVRLLSQESGVVGVGIDGTADAINKFQGVHGLPVNKALQVNMIEAVLGLQAVGHALSNGLYDDDRCIKVSALIHLPHNPVYECAKEVTLAKLDDTLGAMCLWSGGAI